MPIFSNNIISLKTLIIRLGSVCIGMASVILSDLIGVTLFCNNLLTHYLHQEPFLVPPDEVISPNAGIICLLCMIVAWLIVKTLLALEYKWQQGLVFITTLLLTLTCTPVLALWNIVFNPIPIVICISFSTLSCIVLARL